MRLFDWLFKKKKKVGLALSGGAARGIAHIGVLKVLSENQIHIHYISGTSAGALIGSLFAAGIKIEEMIEAAHELWWGDFARFIVHLHGPIASQAVEDFIIKKIGKIHFNQLKIPLWIIAADLLSGEEIVLKEGEVAKAVSASTAFAGVYTPVAIGQHLLVDGCLVNNVPVNRVQQMGATLTIACDVVPQVMLSRKPSHVLEVIDRSIDIGVKNLSKKISDTADFVLEPVKTSVFSLELDKADALIKMGEEAALKIILQLKRELE